MAGTNLLQADLSFSSTGIITKMGADDMQETAWQNLTNIMVEQEGVLSTRRGVQIANFNGDLDTSAIPSTERIHSLYSMLDSVGNRWLYAITDGGNSTPSGSVYIALVATPVVNDPGTDPGTFYPKWTSGTGAGTTIRDINRFYSVGIDSNGVPVSSAISDFFPGGLNGAPYMMNWDARAIFASFFASGKRLCNYMAFADGYRLKIHPGGNGALADLGLQPPLNAILKTESSLPPIIHVTPEMTHWLADGAVVWTPPKPAVHNTQVASAPPGGWVFVGISCMITDSNTGDSFEGYVSPIKVTWTRAGKNIRVWKWLCNSPTVVQGFYNNQSQDAGIASQGTWTPSSHQGEWYSYNGEGWDEGNGDPLVPIWWPASHASSGSRPTNNTELNNSGSPTLTITNPETARWLQNGAVTTHAYFNTYTGTTGAKSGSSAGGLRNVWNILETPVFEGEERVFFGGVYPFNDKDKNKAGGVDPYQNHSLSQGAPPSFREDDSLWAQDWTVQKVIDYEGQTITGVKWKNNAVHYDSGHHHWEIGELSVNVEDNPSNSISCLKNNATSTGTGSSGDISIDKCTNEMSLVPIGICCKAVPISDDQGGLYAYNAGIMAYKETFATPKQFSLAGKPANWQLDGWRIYAGLSYMNLRRVDVGSEQLDMGVEYFDLPGLEGTLTGSPKFPDYGVVAYLNNYVGTPGKTAVKLSIPSSTPNADVISGCMRYVLPEPLDLGDHEPTDKFTFYIKNDSGASSNGTSLIKYVKIRFIPEANGFADSDKAIMLADVEPYYYATIDGNGISSTGGVYTLTKKNIFPSTPTMDDMWNTISAVHVEMVGYRGASIILGQIDAQLTGRLSGGDLTWYYTYYDQASNTESNPSPLKVVSRTWKRVRVGLQFPIITENELNDATHIRIYRSGDGVAWPQLVWQVSLSAPPPAPTDLYYSGAGGEGAVTDTVRVLLSRQYMSTTGSQYWYIDNIPNIQLGELMEIDNDPPMLAPMGVVWWDGRLWTWGGYNNWKDPSVENASALPLRETSNKLRWSKSSTPRAWPSDNYLFVGSGEDKIIRCFIWDGEMFVSTATAIWRIVPLGDGNYGSQVTANKLALAGRMSICPTARVCIIRAYDGLYSFPAGKKISDAINHLLITKETIGSMLPVRLPENSVAPAWATDQIEVYDSKVIVSYQSDSYNASKLDINSPDYQNDRTIVYDVVAQRWGWYGYGMVAMHHIPEIEKLLGANGIWQSGYSANKDVFQLESGYCDRLRSGYIPIPYTIETKDFDLGTPDNQKLLYDIEIDGDTALSSGAHVFMRFDSQLPTTTVDKVEITTAQHNGVFVSNGRGRKVYPMTPDPNEPRDVKRTSMIIEGESPATPSSDRPIRFHRAGIRYTMEPEKHRDFQTPWDNGGGAGDKFWTNFWIEYKTDSTNATATVRITKADGTQTMTQPIPIIPGNGLRVRNYFPIGIDVTGELGRIEIQTLDLQEIQVYDYGFVTMPKSTGMKVAQTEWTDAGYLYRKHLKHVVIDTDTGGAAIPLDLWVDGRVVDTWTVQTTTRLELTHSLPMETFGKLFRLTTHTGENIELYAQPHWVYDKRNPEITLGDAYEQTLQSHRKKVLRKIHYVIENPNSEVALTVWVDNIQRGTFTIPPNGNGDPADIVHPNLGMAPDMTIDGIHPTYGKYPKYGYRRLDFPPYYKGKLFRFCFQSDKSFEIDWEKTEITLRDLNSMDVLRTPELPPPATY